MVRDYAALPLGTAAALLKSPWHEERLLAVLILARQYDRGSEAERSAIFRLYMASLDRVNNWDIVDASAPRIVGRHLAGKGRGTLTRLARSRHLWSRRVAVLEAFLAAHARRMPRTMLRYAIEKLPPADRKRHMKKDPA